MSYQNALLAMDVASEGYWKDYQQKEAIKAREKEEEAKDLWSIGLGILGGLVGGPLGYGLGSSFGTFVGDALHDSEDVKITNQGNFHKAQVRDFNESLSVWDDKTDFADILSVPINLFQAYKWAGAFDEGFSLSNIVDTDPTKWAMPDGGSVSSLQWISNFINKNKNNAQSSVQGAGIENVTEEVQSNDPCPFSLNLTDEYESFIGTSNMPSPQNPAIQAFLGSDIVSDPETSSAINENLGEVWSTDTGLLQINDYHWNDKSVELFDKPISELSQKEYFQLADTIAQSPQGLENWTAFNKPLYLDALKAFDNSASSEALVDAYNRRSHKPLTPEMIDDINTMSFDGYRFNQILALIVAESGGDPDAIMENR